MACPYFFPVERLAGCPGSPLLPLGDAYAGECHVGEVPAPVPDGPAVIEFCNLGYARTRCPRLTAAEGPDAVRFAIAERGTDAIRVLFVVEKDHLPHAQGELLCRLNGAPRVEDAGNPLLARQAQAYVRSYLRRIQDHDSQAGS